MNDTKTLLINNIALTYKSEYSPLLTPFEIKQHIESAEFFEDVLKYGPKFTLSHVHTSDLGKYGLLSDKIDLNHSAA